MIACSNKHSLIQSTDNRVWACSLAHHFALGMMDTVDLLEPRPGLLSVEGGGFADAHRALSFRVGAFSL